MSKYYRGKPPTQRPTPSGELNFANNFPREPQKRTSLNGEGGIRKELKVIKFNSENSFRIEISRHCVS